MVTLKRIGTIEEETPVKSSGTVTLKKIQTGAQSASPSVSNSAQKAGGVTLKKIENYTPTLAEERANEQDKLLTESESRKSGATQNKQVLSGSEIAAGIVKKGLNEFSQSLGATGAALEKVIYSPLDLVTGEKFGTAAEVHGLFSKAYENDVERGEMLAEKYNAENNGKVGQAIDKYGTMTVAAVPDALLAIATAGTSEAATTAKLAAKATKAVSPSISAAAAQVVKNYAKNPQFWTSFARVFGQGYYQAKEDGASEADAYSYALGNGMLNAAIEVGGGIQTLPDGLQDQSVWKAIGKTMYEEAGEEIKQGITERGLQNILYNKGNPIYSTTDENAILNPYTAAQEGIGGAVVGGLLGAGQSAVIGGLNTIARSAQQGQAQTEAVQKGNLTQEAENGAESEKTGVTLRKITPEESGAQVQQTEPTQGVTLKRTGTKAETAQMPTFGGLKNGLLTDSEGRTYDNIAAEQKAQQERPEDYESAKRMGNLTNRKIKWFTDADTSKNGFYDKANNEIWLNTESKNPVAQVIAHELTHSIEETDSYEDFETLIFREMLKKNGQAYIDAQRQEKRDLYARHGVTLENDIAVNQEILAEYVEKHLLTDEKEIRRICQTDRSLGQKILDKINELLAKVGFKSANERRYLENARNMYASALAESNRTTESDLDAARAELRAELERGEITQEEYDDAVQGMDIGLEELSGEKYSINPDFENEIDGWDGSEGKTFTIGTTSSALKSIGVKDRVIKWTSDSLLHSLKHKGMSIGAAKQVPELLENPVTVMQSRSVYDRIVMLGEVYDENGTPVLAVLEINPKKNNGEILDMNIVNNVYGKDRGIENFLKFSNYLYIDPDKKRTDTWFQSLGLQLPSGNTMYGSIGTISYENGDVKIKGVPWNKLGDNIGEMEKAPAGIDSRVYRYGKGTALSTADAYRKNVSQESGGVKRQFSISEKTEDSEGERLSRKQREYFADSKIRNENGNLLVVYHGTTEDFTVFDRSKTRANMDIQGMFFSPWEEDSGGYGDNVRAFYLNIKNPAPEQVAYQALNKYKGQNNAGIKAREELIRMGYDGVNNENEEYIAFYPEQIKLTTNENPTEDADIRFDISEQEEAQEEKQPEYKEPIFGAINGATSNDLYEDAYGKTYEEKLREGMSERNKLPAKARNSLHRAERYAEVTIGENVGVPKAAQREFMRPIVQEISDEYLKTGKVSQETQDRLFETAYDNGIVADNDFYEQYKEVKNKLRTEKVQISEEDTHDIPDYGTWKKSVFGTLNIVKSGGVSVDVMYEEMQDMAPELFPSDITAPSDQLQQMAQVGKSIQKAEKTLQDYYGKNAEEQKQWLRNNFDAAINKQLSELHNIKRYADEKNAKIRGPKEITTQEELKQAYMTLKDARKAYEKADSKALLTNDDKMKVGQLLRGEITPESLNPDMDNYRDIMAVYEAKKPYEEITKVIRNYNKQRQAGLKDIADVFLQTANEWKDKKAGIMYSRETMERNVRDIVPDAELADAIVDTYFKPVHDAQAASTRMKNEFRDRIRKLNLSREVDKGNIVSEAYAVQLYGEAMDNITMLEKSRGKLKRRDGKTLEDWQGVITDLWKNNPDIDRGKVESAVEEFRDAYDELFQKMNETRLRNGYEPINYRKGYFPHFQPQQSDGLLGLFGKAIGLETEVTALPTQINGITHMFRPGIQWFGNAQERLGFATAYDAVEGFDKYIEGAADVIHQTDNIQKLRALASQVRYRTSDEGIQKQVDEVLASDKLTEEQKKNEITAIYESGRFKLSNFAVELDEYTNLLANKKSKADRNMEQMLGRGSYNAVKALESRVAANMVAINPASWLTNFIPITQAAGAVDSKHILQGMWMTLKDYKTPDGLKGASTFLTNREGSEPLIRTREQELSAKMSKPMEWIDQFTAGSIVRARFMQNVDRGMSGVEALSDADAFAAGVMADRSKGSMPTLFHQANPLTKVLTQFQLEVNNQLSYIFKDLPRDKKEEGAKALAMALFKFFLGAYLYDNVYEFFIGRRPALDPIGILNDSVGDFTGYQLPSVLEVAEGLAAGETLGEQFKTERKGAWEAVSGAAEDTLENLPFVGGLLGGGRVPISSALPDWENLGKAVFSEDMNTKKRLSTIAKELTGPASYILLPFGGGQLKKITQGSIATARGGSYTVDSQGRDILQYPVYNDTAGDIFSNAFVAGLFGKTATEEGKKWIESGFENLSAKETQAYKDMQEAGGTQREAYALIQETGNVERVEGYKKEIADILLSSDADEEAKAALFYDVYATDSEREKIDTMVDNGMSKWSAAKMFLQGKADGESNAKDLLMASKDVSDSKKAEIYFEQYASDSEINAYKQYGKGISKTAYYQFLVKTDDITADKDANGKTVSGSKKKKVLDVINAMDLSVEQKNAMYYMAGYSESTLYDDAPWYNLKFKGKD